MRPIRYPAMQAFTLVELAMVLVIIGLLAGGVLTAQSLIRAAELRSLTTDLTNIQTASYTFRDKYFYLPGDLPNATQFWGIAGGSTGKDDACYTMTNTTRETCDGNGDGRVYDGFSTTTHAERGHYWKHLSNAGLIEGTYAGYHGPASAEIRRAGYNTKGTKLSGVHWNAAFAELVPNPALDSRFYDEANTNVVELGPDMNGAEVLRKVLTPLEQWNMDSKIDDGKPATGNVRGPKQGWAYAPDCTDSTALTASYATTIDTKECFPTIYLR